MLWIGRSSSTEKWAACEMSYKPPTGPCGSRPPTTTPTVTRSASRTTAYCASPRPENRMSPVEDTLRSTHDAYPADLARFVRERWDEDRAGALPDQGTLETLISACYQAGLLREEERRYFQGDPMRSRPAAGARRAARRDTQAGVPEAQTVRRPADKAALTSRRLLPLAHRGLFRRGRGVEDLGPRPHGTEVVEGG